MRVTASGSLRCARNDEIRDLLPAFRCHCEEAQPTKQSSSFPGRAPDNPIEYRSQPNWPTYAGLLAFAETLKRDLAALRQRDLIDIQSFIWV